MSANQESIARVPLTMASQNPKNSPHDERADHNRSFRLNAIRLLESLLAEGAKPGAKANFTIRFSTHDGRNGKLTDSVKRFHKT